MALLIVYDAATAIQEQTNRRPFPLRISEREREIRRLSSVFGAARKYSSGWIGQVILIVWKCSVTLTVKLNYAPNKNSSFFLLQEKSVYCRFIFTLCVCVVSGLFIYFLQLYGRVPKVLWLTYPWTNTLGNVIHPFILSAMG